MKMHVLWIGSILCFTGCNFQQNGPVEKAKELFSIDDAGAMRYLSSDLRITTRELKDWDEIASNLLKESSLGRDGDGYRLYAYLYYAQKCFADMSFAMTNVYSGTLDYISLSVVNLFYPEFQNHSIKKDDFSEELSERIMKKIKRRFQDEESQIHSSALPYKEGAWNGRDPVGLDSPTLKPWVLNDAGEFKTPEPPSSNDPFWKNQLKATQEHLESATEGEKQKSYFWQHMVDPDASDWRFIAVDYMNKEDIPLEMQLEVRSKMMMALVDALIAVFRDKYAYRVRRPFMLDSNLKPLFTTPNHPSYPAAHATISAAAEMILSYYFPENQRHWEKLGHEARVSRLWGGIHFPIDLDVGNEQGQQVGKAVIFR